MIDSHKRLGPGFVRGVWAETQFRPGRDCFVACFRWPGGACHDTQSGE
jgi:hypothetical protein